MVYTVQRGLNDVGLEKGQPISRGALERGAIHRATTELVAERQADTVDVCVTCQVIYVDLHQWRLDQLRVFPVTWKKQNENFQYYRC